MNPGTFTAGRLAKLFKGKLPEESHGRRKLIYLVHGIPCPRKDVLKLEPNTEVEVKTYDQLRPNAAEDTVSKG